MNRVAHMMALLVFFFVSGCKESRQDSGDDKQKSKSDDDDSTSDSAQSDLLDGGGAAAFQAVLANADKPGLYDDPKQSENYKKGEPHHVVMDLSGPIVEIESVQMWGNSAGTELRTLGDRLLKFASDENVTSMIFKINELAISGADAQELRRVFKKVQEKGKKIHCHSEGLSNWNYAVASACDTLTLSPLGDVVVTGAAATPMHLKPLLDKWNIKADFLHVGAFKGAAEPLTRDAPSKEMKETLDAIIQQSYDVLVENISSSRKLEKEKVSELIDQALFPGEAALTAGLADSVATFEAMMKEQVGDQAWRHVGLKPKQDLGMAKLMELLGTVPKLRSNDDHVALLYAVGNIVDGDGEGVIGARSEIASGPLTAAIRSVTRAESVKAVVLRIDSGGGSALASETIWQSLAQLTKKKPLVVSMSDVAASGGYYIAAGANTIFAEENTLTGSIGVVGGKMVIGRALDKLGIKSYSMRKGKRALIWSPIDSWNDDEKKAVYQMMEDVYKTFVGRVSEGRKKTYDEIHEIAQGRVWTGRKALELGLVDEIGGLDDALAKAYTLADIKDEQAIEVYPPEPTIFDLASSFGGVQAPFGMESLFEQVTMLYGERASFQLFGVLRQLQNLLVSPLQTTLFWPIVWD